MTKRKLFQTIASKAGISASMIEKIYYQQKRASGDLALKLEAAIGVEAPYWVWPERYDLHQRIQEVMGVEV